MGGGVQASKHGQRIPAGRPMATGQWEVLGRSLYPSLPLPGEHHRACDQRRPGWFDRRPDQVLGRDQLESGADVQGPALPSLRDEIVERRSSIGCPATTTRTRSQPYPWLSVAIPDGVLIFALVRWSAYQLSKPSALSVSIWL